MEERKEKMEVADPEQKMGKRKYKMIKKLKKKESA